MKSIASPVSRVLTRALAVLTLVAAPLVFAGTPLICHPYDIGTAKSLPAGPDWHGVSRNYDRTQLVGDTLALLTPETPLMVRMETMRRAAIYATAWMRDWDKGAYTDADRALAFGLLARLKERANEAKGPALALALFDVGFFTETLRQTNIDKTLDGYPTLVKAAELRGPDAEMEFALALATSWPKRPERDAHITRARTLAKKGSLVATNLETHFGKS
ncbi:MAG TPA: hypothetical protein VM029_20080 [Opitutaceae bacterium]|nr:hypothetical protein [Opitutaceae bacterium]